jgi:hypothetical protein
MVPTYRRTTQCISGNAQFYRVHSWHAHKSIQWNAYVANFLTPRTSIYPFLLYCRDWVLGSQEALRMRETGGTPTIIGCANDNMQDHRLARKRWQESWDPMSAPTQERKIMLRRFNGTTAEPGIWSPHSTNDVHWLGLVLLPDDSLFWQILIAASIGIFGVCF